MPKTRRNKQEYETANRRQLIARMYLQGVNQYAIAEHLGISQPAVSKHLLAIRDQWRESAIEDTNELKAAELAKIDEVIRCAYEGWATSRKGGNEGNPAFLNVIQSCIEKRVRIFGLNANTLAEVVGGLVEGLPWLEEMEPPKDVELTNGKPKRIEDQK